MELSQVERQILINQYEILRLLSKRDQDRERYESLTVELHERYPVPY